MLLDMVSVKKMPIGMPSVTLAADAQTLRKKV